MSLTSVPPFPSFLAQTMSPSMPNYATSQSGTTTESGADSSTSSYLGPYTTTGTASNGGDDASNDSYNGAGAYTVSGGSAGAVSGDSAPTGSGATTESGADHSADNYSSDYMLGSDGNWYAADGSGTSTASGNTHSSNASNGAYGYTFVGGGVSGTWNQAGGGDTNYTTQTVSALNADGSWATTGAAQSGGRCLFVMPKGPDWRAITASVEKQH
jgi:hypothetical protein